MGTTAYTKANGDWLDETGFSVAGFCPIGVQMDINGGKRQHFAFYTDDADRECIRMKSDTVLVPKDRQG